MLERLDEIRWDRLEHNYGSAEDLPGLLRTLAGPAQEDAPYELGNLLLHQGGWICSAAPAALPFLVDLATASGNARRARIVGIVASLAREAEQLAGRNVDPAWPQAWAAAVPRLLTLAGDADVEVRRRVPYALGAARPQAGEVVPPLMDRFSHEPDLAVRLGLVLAVGELTGGELTRGEPVGGEAGAANGWLRDLHGHAEPQVRLAATIASGRAGEDLDVVLDAIDTGDLTPWRDNPWISGTPESVIYWVDAELVESRPARTRLAARLLGHADPGRRAGAVKVAARVLTTWRSAMPDLLPLLAERLDSPDETLRAFAAHLIVASGSAGDHADRIVAASADDTRLSRRQDTRISDIAVWGMARTGDERALPELVERIAGKRTGFPLTANHFGGSVYMLDLPGLQEVLSRLSRWADELLPAVRGRLRPGGPLEMNRALAQTLEAWGPAAAPAVPELAGLLEGEARQWAVRALGAIGEPAAEVAPALRPLVRFPLSPPGQPVRNAGRFDAAWALWRITGEAGPMLELSVAALEQNTAVTDAAWRLADLGRTAARHADLLRGLLKSTGEWERVEAAHALWRVTGDSAEAIPVLAETIRPLAEGRATPVMRQATGYLAEIGSPTGDVVALLETAQSLDVRLNYFGGWRAFTEDEEQRLLIRRALGDGGAAVGAF
ncbi:hypothetical protein [Planotetraspora kaengkrachanensis]|uniref:HEAT repeat domain-containing protein n=1 Tax=Planotetraspora kaengkrachanensis TaxID=575193 RepID=A0A8J3M280_9ACTN|nr:hypothetical protein [Planotetraspora kaengkrachanensis]GIG77661.1 hypothetical protein Pka01_07880 [Planotetraspora kaengkrachanensis]